MSGKGPVYWDSSAVLSALLEDAHTAPATRAIGESRVHLLSTLAVAEVAGVMARMVRDRLLTEVLARSAATVLQEGPWRYLNAGPERGVIEALARKHALRGADLWHLAAAKTLAMDLPGLELLTFDRDLAQRARAEGL